MTAAGALASAFLLALSYPPLHLFLPPFVALTPFAVAVASLPADGPGPLRAFRAGVLLGTASWGVLLYWIVVALHRTPVQGVLAWGGVTAVLALVAGAVGWTLHRLLYRARLPVWVALPLAWTGGEWLRAHLPGSLAAPWLGLGTSLTGTPEVVGVAEVVGARGVTLWLALVAGLLAEAVLRGRHAPVDRAQGPVARGAPPALAAVLLALAPAAWGVWRAAHLPVRDTLRVAVIQPAVPEALRRDPARVEAATFAALDRLVSRVEEAEERDGPVDMVVLPEALFPTPLDAPEGRPLVDRLAAFARRSRAPLLVGGLALGGPGEPDGHASVPRHNSVFLVDEDGLRPARWDKRHLVPLVERVPLFPGLRRLEEAGADRGAWARSLEPGREGMPVPVTGAGGGAEVGAFVCYEAAFADVARGLRRRGAEVLVNVSNDAWFGVGAPFGRTAALWQHPAHLVMRAIETRAGIVRATNTGLSFFVEPGGRVRGVTPLFEPAVRVATVRTADVVTPFVRYGDVAGAGAAGLTALLVLWTLLGQGLGGHTREARG